MDFLQESHTQLWPWESVLPGAKSAVFSDGGAESPGAGGVMLHPRISSPFLRTCQAVLLALSSELATSGRSRTVELDLPRGSLQEVIWGQRGCWGRTGLSSVLAASPQPV